MSRSISTRAVRSLGWEAGNALHTSRSEHCQDRPYFQGKYFAFVEAFAILSGQTWGQAADELMSAYRVTLEERNQP